MTQKINKRELNKAYEALDEELGWTPPKYKEPEEVEEPSNLGETLKAITFFFFFTISILGFVAVCGSWTNALIMSVISIVISFYFL
jgi:hypothetical protein